MSKATKKFVRLLVFGVAVVFAVILSLNLAQIIETNEIAKQLVAQFGYIGIVVLSIISGVNVILPVPAATFVPVFIAAGLSMPFIILALVIGTTIADFVGYFIGDWSRDFAKEHYPETYNKVLYMNERHHTWLLPIVFFYSAFVPFPNEAMIIPLALVGVHWRKFIIPLVLGTVVNQTALALGVANIFEFLF